LNFISPSWENPLAVVDSKKHATKEKTEMPSKPNEQPNKPSGLLFDVILHTKREPKDGKSMNRIKLHAKPSVGDTIHYEDDTTDELWEVIHVTLSGNAPGTNYDTAGTVNVIQDERRFQRD
jgi:hypothetical protein